MTSNAADSTLFYLHIIITWASLVLATNLWTVGMIGYVYW